MTQDLTFKIILLTALTAVFSGCSKSSDSSISVKADYINVSATVNFLDGTPAKYSDIYLPGIGSPISSTNEEGVFNVTISESTLTKSKQIWLERTNENIDKFQLIISNSLDPDKAALAAATKKIAYSLKGKEDLGIITLTPSSTLTGTVNYMSDAGELIAASGIEVFAAHKHAITGEDGLFEIDGLPANITNVYATSRDFSTAQTIITIKSNETKALNAPLVVFTDNMLSGWITPIESQPLSYLIASGHPFQKSFAVSSSPRVKYVRYHHSRDELEKSGADAAWIPIRNRIDYDFPRNGGHSLFVQFANSDKSQQSSILTIQTNVNTFGVDSEIVIGDGSGVIYNRNASISINYPPTATQMRMHHFESELDRAARQPVSEVTEYVFPYLSSPSSAFVTIFVQFSDAQGNYSDVYKASAVISIFPPAQAPVLLIENGAELHYQRQVMLGIDVPFNAVEMAISELPILETGNLFDNRFNASTPAWLPVQSQFQYTFRSIGLNQLYIQFRDVDGSVSSVYTTSIRILPFDPRDAGDGFYINNGDPLTPVRETTITLDPPPEAFAYRFSEGVPPSTLTPWSALTPNVLHVLSGNSGTKTIYLEYQDKDGNLSYTYQHSIHYDPFYNNSGYFEINNNSGFAINPTMDLFIDVPLGATQMLVLDLSNPFFPNSGYWQSAQAFAQFTVQSMGTKTLSIQFRNVDGDLSPAFQRTVLYNPFPVPYGHFLIDNGAPQTSERNVLLSFDLPPSAYEISIATSAQSTNAWFVVSNTKNFELPATLGNYTIYVQYRTIDGDISPKYQSQITLVSP